jgi:hypothetical protein
MIELLNRTRNVAPNFDPNDVGAEVACQYVMHIGMVLIFLRIVNSMSTENMKTLKYLDNQVVMEALEQQLTLIETVTGQLFESSDVVGGSPTDILYVWAWPSPFLNELNFMTAENMENLKPI